MHGKIIVRCWSFSLYDQDIWNNILIIEIAYFDKLKSVNIYIIYQPFFVKGISLNSPFVKQSAFKKSYTKVSQIQRGVEPANFSSVFLALMFRFKIEA